MAARTAKQKAALRKAQGLTRYDAGRNFAVSPIRRKAKRAYRRKRRY